MESAGERRLKLLRRRIDAIDRLIVRLLEQRAAAAREIGALKMRQGLPVQDRQRERQVLERAAGATKLDKKFVKGVFTKVIYYCRKQEK
ncbi:MAG: chorismate mutase [Candidatus Altiarchaeota archaeon]|nr:chorismate mutase [Candidatus Altiarchaeota archaeon]